MALTQTIGTRLAERVRARGSSPLVTYYDLDTGERTELSTTSFANWVDKTSNLLATLGIDDGNVAGPLSVEHPGHWISLIWPLAAWQHGCSYAAVARPAATGADLAVTGPRAVESIAPGATVACSLHPLALPLPDLPAGVIDFTKEVLAESDAHWVAPVAPDAPAWVDETRSLTHRNLNELDPIAGRVLVRPSTAWETLATALLRPLLGGGSSVVVVGDAEQERLERLVAGERVTLGMP